MPKHYALKLFVLTSLAAAAAFGDNQSKPEPMTVAVQNGTVAFVSNTNVPAISVKGKSNALEARVSLRRTPDGLQLEHIDARLPVKTLVTGMGMRDEHMRKYIFTAADGNVPDLHFAAETAACTGGGREATCQVAGSLTIRGIAKPFTIPLKVREDGSGFRASGDAVLKLSTYGIEQPSQLGVKTTDEVELHFDFNAKPAAIETAANGGHR
jgi:polyisoprenoid-binding protein YceI